MILITLGTQDKSFIRLLEEVERLIKINIIKGEVIVQAGSTKYESPNMKIFDLIDKDEFDNLMDEADYIITHAGVGTILSALLKNKKVVALPRLKKYQEHVNDHQIELVENFAKEGYILGANDVSELESLLKKLPNFEPKNYIETRDDLINYIEEFIG